MLKAGDPLDERTTLGPLSTEQALVDLLKQVDVAVKHGAKVLMGGKRIDRAGSFMHPTILTDVTPDNPAFRDEFFGPVAMFFRVKDEDAAIALANAELFEHGNGVLHHVPVRRGTHHHADQHVCLLHHVRPSAFRR